LRYARSDRARSRHSWPHSHPPGDSARDHAQGVDACPYRGDRTFQQADERQRVGMPRPCAARCSRGAISAARASETPHRCQGDTIQLNLTESHAVRETTAHSSPDREYDFSRRTTPPIAFPARPPCHSPV
jgi:hypothetical protein